MDYLRVILVRLKNNPKVSRKVKTKFAADLKLIEWFESEDDLRYHVALACQIADGIREISARKKAPELQALNPMHKEAFIKKLALPPEVTSEHDALKILTEVKAAMKNG